MFWHVFIQLEPSRPAGKQVGNLDRIAVHCDKSVSDHGVFKFSGSGLELSLVSEVNMLGSSHMSPCTSLQSIVTRSVSLQACRELTMVHHSRVTPCANSLHVSPATLQHDLYLGVAQIT